MNRIDENMLADLVFQVNWQTYNVRHAETYSAHQVNFWRDILPERLAKKLAGKQPGDQIMLNYQAGELVSCKTSPQIKTINRRNFDQGPQQFQQIRPPRPGRFYPKGLITGLPGIFSANVEPFRCVELKNGHMAMDFSHPLAQNPLHLTVTVGSVQLKSDERGGSVRDWAEIITQGPGMQARWRNEPTDFFSDDTFSREDDQPDSFFYSQPRLIQHLDETALNLVEQTYSRFLRNGMRVLDLMGSWKSHLDKELRFNRLTGLGLNTREMESNNRLTDFIVHDLNLKPAIPLPDSAYDAVICTVSVEYLTQPIAVFREVARVLKPGGRFILTFSNRWFPPKAIQIWKELHEFERMGLVLEYFHKSAAFKNLESYSIRGLMRPFNDKYYGQLPYSDPVYAVCGERMAA